MKANISKALLGDTAPQYILSLDQEKCFDQLFLEALADVVDHIGLPGADVALGVYRNLHRLRYIDNQPTAK